MKKFFALVIKDIRADLRETIKVIFMPVYFTLVTILFPLALGPSTDSLAFLAPGLLIVLCTLTSLIGIERLFAQDIQTGFLENVILSKTSLTLYVWACLTSHLILAGLPLIILSPFIAIALGLSPNIAFWPVPAVLLLCLFYLLEIGCMIRALTIGVAENRTLIAILALPLFIPALIFAAGTLHLAASGLPYESPFLFLGALVLAFVVIAPYVSAILLRWSIRS